MKYTLQQIGSQYRLIQPGNPNAIPVKLETAEKAINYLVRNGIENDTAGLFCLPPYHRDRLNYREPQLLMDHISQLLIEDKGNYIL